MKPTKYIFPCLICALALLSGCTKEPTMFEKCFVAEQKKLEELPDEVLFSRFEYSSELHRIFRETLATYQALDMELLVSLEEKERTERARARELQSQNPLYQKYEKLWENHLKTECCGDQWSGTSEAYREAQTACEDDAACHIYVTDYPGVAALIAANPEYQLWDAFGSDINALMKDRDWSSIFGEDHKPKKYSEDNFMYNFIEASRELYPDDELASSERSPRESVQAWRDLYMTWLEHWLGEFEVKRQAVFDQFDSIARETCNTRGLYE